MRLYLLDKTDGSITPLDGVKKPDPRRGDILIVRSEPSAAHTKEDRICFEKDFSSERLELTKKELDALVRTCGGRQIRSGRIGIYTPRLFLEELQADRGGLWLLKLEELCYIASDKEIREIGAVELMKSPFSKYIQHSTALVKGD